MNKVSFNKIINLDKNISIEDLKKSLEYFLTIDDENIKKVFLNNYKKAISIFFKKNSLETKINLSIYEITDIDAYNIDQELSGTTIFMIDNSPYEITREEKEKVIKFLEDRDIPLYIKVYKQAFKKIC